MRAPSVRAASACARACCHGCLPVAQHGCMYQRVSPRAQPWAQQHQHWEQRPAGWSVPAPRHPRCIGRPAAAFERALKDATRRAPAPWPRRRARGARGRTPHPPRSARPRPPRPPRGHAARPSAAPGRPPRLTHTLCAPKQTTLAPSSAQSCTPHELLRCTCAPALPSRLAAAECWPVECSQHHRGSSHVGPLSSQAQTMAVCLAGSRRFGLAQECVRPGRHQAREPAARQQRGKVGVDLVGRVQVLGALFALGRPRRLALGHDLRHDLRAPGRASRGAAGRRGCRAATASGGTAVGLTLL